MLQPSTIAKSLKREADNEIDVSSVPHLWCRAHLLKRNVSGCGGTWYFALIYIIFGPMTHEVMISNAVQYASIWAHYVIVIICVTQSRAFLAVTGFYAGAAVLTLGSPGLSFLSVSANFICEAVLISGMSLAINLNIISRKTNPASKRASTVRSQ